MKRYLGLVPLFLIPVLSSAAATWSLRHPSDEYSLIIGTLGALGMLFSAVWLTLAITGINEPDFGDDELSPEEQEWLDNYFKRRGDPAKKG